MARPPLVPPGPELTAPGAHPLRPPPPAARPRPARAAPACGRAGAGRRSRWPRVAGPALPRGRRGGHHRRRRRRRRRHHQPAAPGGARGGRRGAPKTASAADAVHAISPSTQVVRHTERLDEATALEIVADYDLVLDGADNFPTRYLVGDACARLGVPHVWGSVFRFDGQVSVWWAGEGPCYACVFPAAAAAGRRAVLRRRRGARRGVREHRVGQATEAVKLVTGIGEPLVGRLLVHDALRQTWDALPVAADPGCPVCGSGADLTRPLGWATGVPDAGRRTTDAGDAGRAPRDRPSIDVVGLRRCSTPGRSTVRRAVLLDVREEGERAVVALPGGPWLPIDEVPRGCVGPRAGAGRPRLRLLQVGRPLGRGGRPAARAGGRRGERRGRHPGLGRARSTRACRPTDGVPGVACGTSAPSGRRSPELDADPVARRRRLGGGPARPG